MGDRSASRAVVMGVLAGMLAAACSRGSGATPPSSPPALVATSSAHAPMLMATGPSTPPGPTSPDTHPPPDTDSHLVPDGPDAPWSGWRTPDGPGSGGPLAPPSAPFGRVLRMDVRVAPWSLPPTPGSVASPGRYERWREKHRASLAFGYLSIVDLSLDERFLLVVSEDEAKIHTYEFPSLKPLAMVSVPGYQQFSRGDFAFAPTRGAPPPVVFAGEGGIVAIDTNVPRATQISPEPGDSIRFTDDHAVLGVSSAAIPAQRSRLVFYRFAPNGGLEPLALLEFSERVEEWDLDSAKRRLAVTYYPSNQTEVVDLQDRRVLWTAGAPQYSNSVDVSGDDTRLAVGGSSVVVHDLATGRPIASDSSFGNNIHRVRFSPSGDALAVSSYEGKIRLFDARSPGPALRLRKLLRHAGTANVYALEFTRDGSALVSGSGDQTVRVWGE